MGAGGRLVEELTPLSRAMKPSTVYFYAASILLGAAWLVGCDDSPTAAGPISSVNASKVRGMPVHLSALRNEEGSSSSLITVLGGPGEGGWELVQVSSRNPEKNGRFYKRTDVTSRNPSYLSRLESLKCLSEIEDLLKDYYGGKVLDEIRSERSKLNGLSGGGLEEMLEHQDSSDRFDAHLVLETVDRYRATLSEP